MLLALNWAFSLTGRILQRETEIAIHLAPELPVAVQLPFPLLGDSQATAWDARSSPCHWGDVTGLPLEPATYVHQSRGLWSAVETECASLGLAFPWF